MLAILSSESMMVFLDNISSFPTVVFSFLFGVMFSFWLLSLLGVVGIDSLDLDVGEGVGEALAGFFVKCGFDRIPFSIVISLVSLFGWVICYYLVYFFFFWVPSGILQYLLGSIVLIVSFFLAIMLTNIVLRPFKSLLQRSSADGEKVILGQTAIVRSSKVTSEYGEVIVTVDGAELLLKVISLDGKVFQKGDQVIIFEKVANADRYTVISEQEFYQ